MANPVVVVAGMPVLARSLETTGLFPRVLASPDVSGLKAHATGSDLRGMRPGDVVFIVSDSVPSSEPAFPLGEFIRRVSGAGYRVLIVAQTAGGVDLHRDFPQTGLLTVPLRLNDVMFALANYGFSVGPLPYGSEPLDLQGSGTPAPNGAAAWVDTPPVTQQGAWGAQPSRSPTPSQVSGAGASSGWSEPAAPGASGWQQPSDPVLPPPPAGPQTSSPPMPTGGSAWPSPNPTQLPSPPNTQPVGGGWTPPTGNSPRTLADLAGRSAGNSWGGAQQGVPTWPAPGSADVAPAYRSGAAPQNADNRSPSRRRGMVITVSVSKGGTGKSTLSLNLAAYLGSRFKNANPGRSVCIIDCNYQQADTGKYMGQFTPNIVNLIKDPSLMTPERITSALVHRTDMNFSALLGPATPDDALALLTADTGQAGNSFSARFYNEVLDLLRPHYDYIFIDTPVAEKFHSLFRDFALPAADYLVVPVIPSKQTVHNTYMWLNSAVIAPKVARGAGLRPEQIGIVLNRAEEGVGYGELEVMEELRMFNYLGSVPETTEWKRANNEGELIAARNKSDINEAFARILGQVTGEPTLLQGLPAEDDEPHGVAARLRGLFRGRR
jgi:cellulose biosynthesis protein BcsQ